MPAKPFEGIYYKLPKNSYTWPLSSTHKQSVGSAKPSSAFAQSRQNDKLQIDCFIINCCWDPVAVAVAVAVDFIFFFYSLFSFIVLLFCFVVLQWLWENNFS